jgi:hypothetical protein
MLGPRPYIQAMRLEINHVDRDGDKGADVVVTLSKRNLLALLHKTSDAGSARELRASQCYIDGDAAPITLELVVRSESDETHYEESPAGPLTAATEAFVAEATR